MTIDIETFQAAYNFIIQSTSLPTGWTVGTTNQLLSRMSRVLTEINAQQQQPKEVSAEEET